MKMITVKEGWFADFQARNFYQGELTVQSGIVTGIVEKQGTRVNWPETSSNLPVILPGLVDAHIHIESSMLMPATFARAAVRYGTVATVSDPHEIANVLGIDGIRLMVEDSAKGWNLVRFTAPSCVPATPLEESGAVLEAGDLEELLKEGLVVALGEVMNFPGVINGEPSLMEKIALAQRYSLPSDGHAPGLSGTELQQYIDAGISTDHECFTLEEAEEKIAKGMKILIREGSAARNFDALWPLIDRFPEKVMLCSDDLHPDDLLEGHIDRLVRRGMTKGIDFFHLYQAASLTPISHYGLSAGKLRIGDPADFIVVTNLNDFRVESTYLKGIPVFGEGVKLQELIPVSPMNRFEAKQVNKSDLGIHGKTGKYLVIRALDGELITKAEVIERTASEGFIEADPARDILKIVVINRYRNSPPAIGLISGFGLKKGAIASSIAHDSHNLVAVGADDDSLARALNLVIENRGGIAAVSEDGAECLSLPVAGLMSMGSVEQTAEGYKKLTQFAKNLGSGLRAPFMTLSFMSLLVIPHLKMGDRGLFDGDTFSFIPLQVE